MLSAVVTVGCDVQPRETHLPLAEGRCLSPSIHLAWGSVSEGDRFR
jgi:hypothetical protein